jgi:hypothetical protein
MLMEPRAGERVRALAPRLHSLWSTLEVSYVRRQQFCSTFAGLDDNEAEKKMSVEISRLQRLVQLMGREMALVTRREVCVPPIWFHTAAVLLTGCRVRF